MLTPAGVISRYFFGIEYGLKDLKLLLQEASGNKIGSLTDQILLFCFHYDATQGKYTLLIVNVLKIAAGLTIVLLGGLIYLLMRNEKKQKTRAAWKESMCHSRRFAE